jgi:hypothetical protein
MSKGRQKQTSTKGGSWTRKLTATKGITKTEALNVMRGQGEHALIDPVQASRLESGEPVKVSMLLAVQGIPDANGRMRYQKQEYSWVPA